MDVSPCSDQVFGHNLASGLCLPMSAKRKRRSVHASKNSDGTSGDGARATYHLSCTSTLLDVLGELLLLLLKFCSFAIEFSLRLLQCALVLPELLCWRLGPAEEGFDDVHGG